MYWFEMLGLAGVIAIAISWVPQTLKVIKEKKVELSLKFILIYSAGSVILLVYSVIIQDVVFIILNALTTFMAVINLSYGLRR